MTDTPTTSAPTQIGPTCGSRSGYWSGSWRRRSSSGSRQLAGAALGRRPHAHRRRRDRARLVCAQSCSAAGTGSHDLWLQARRGPLRAVQWRHAPRPRAAHRLRGHSPSGRAARRGRRGGARGRFGRGRGQPRRDLDSVEGKPRVDEYRGGLPAHPHRPGGLRRDRHRRGRHPHHGLCPRGWNRSAGRGGDHAAGRPRAAALLRARLPRGGARRNRSGRGGASACRARGGRGRARPTRLGDRLGVSSRRSRYGSGSSPSRSRTSSGPLATAMGTTAAASPAF